MYSISSTIIACDFWQTSQQFVPGITDSTDAAVNTDFPRTDPSQQGISLERETKGN